MTYQVKKGDLFKNAPKGATLVHACNAQGVWGSGIAKQFKERFPESFDYYSSWCQGWKDVASRVSVVGSVLVHGRVACLITSENYGLKVDPPEKILENTRKSVRWLLKPGLYCLTDIHSPKINAGLFKVPWEKTEAIIKEELEKCEQDISWTVWEL